MIIPEGAFFKRMGLRVVLLATFLLLIPCLAPARSLGCRGIASRQIGTRRTAEFEALPLLRSRQNHLLVQASVNGKIAWLGVDSGAPFTAIASHRRAHYRLTDVPEDSELPSRLQVNGSYNNVSIVRHLRLGSLNLLDEPVVVLNLGGSRRSRIVEEQQIDGILGADVLFQCMPCSIAGGDCWC